jgi:hypothetical protein
MDSPRFSRDVLAFLIGAPLAWGVLLMFTGLALFIVAVLLLARGRSAARAPTPLTQPG